MEVIYIQGGKGGGGGRERHNPPRHLEKNKYIYYKIKI